MPYLGNIPATQFAEIKYQDLTGGTGTAFTLDQAVGTAQELEVFVNNVRQEPGVAYTVSGTALTMTGSIVATDDFYVVFQGKSTGTATHPAGQALTATDGTFSGNVLVGKTATGLSTTGFQALATGNQSAFISDGDRALILNRQTSDGSIQEFRKDGTTVGSISSSSGKIAVTLDPRSAATTGSGFLGGDGVIFPSDKAGVASDADVSLGGASTRFKDLYLSGGAYIGGTAAANLFDDYEEGTWTPTVTPSGSGSISITGTSAKYTKIGNQVTVWLKFQISSVSSPTGRIGVSGVPFSATGQPYAATAHVNGFSTFSGKAGALVEASGTFNIDRYINGGISSNLADFAAASAYVFMTATYPVS